MPPIMTVIIKAIPASMIGELLSINMTVRLRPIPPRWEPLLTLATSRGTARQLSEAWHCAPDPCPQQGYLDGGPGDDIVAQDMTDRLRFALRLAALASRDGRHCQALIRQLADEAGYGSVPDGVATPGCAIKRAGWLRARRSSSLGMRLRRVAMTAGVILPRRVACRDAPA
jgi:hypothetical protein